MIADEGVYHAGALVGRITSGGYSYQFGHDIAMALVPPALSAEGTELLVSIHGDLRKARVVPDSMYDPTNARARL